MKAARHMLRVPDRILSFYQAKQLHLYKNLLGKVSFNLSDIGEGIREVIVKEWYVKPGDTVAQFDNICEVQSDKASVTITSRYDGIVSKIYYQVDDVALVGKPLVDIDINDGKSEWAAQPSEESVVEKTASVSVKSTTVPESPTTVPESPTTVPQSPTIVPESPIVQNSASTDVLSIPSVRRLAKEHNLDLSKIVGTGKSGRILKEDVLKFLNIPAQDDVPSQNIPPTQPDVEPIKGFKKAMIKTMTDALKIPHFVYGDEILLTELSKIRKTLQTKHDTKISSLPFFLKAISNSLKRYPIVNSSVDENVENILYHKSNNIGVAMDTTAGLAVPIIKNVETLSVMDITHELQRLVKEGREGKFSLKDLTGGTFTVSNIGPVGGTHLKPVILPPQVAILAIGMSQVLPRFDDNQNVVAEEVVSISASADHRVIDGATMARFCRDVKRQLENPYLLFLNI